MTAAVAGATWAVPTSNVSSLIVLVLLGESPHTSSRHFQRERVRRNAGSRGTADVLRA